jgi:hypothetical protein
MSPHPEEARSAVSKDGPLALYVSSDPKGGNEASGLRVFNTPTVSSRTQRSKDPGSVSAGLPENHAVRWLSSPGSRFASPE